MSNNSFESKPNERRPSFFRSLPKNRRNIFLLLSTLSVAVLILWIWQLNFRLASPFQIPDSEQISISEETDEFKSLLLNNDTDGDGLSDYEERTLYGTSVYLADTDGDGLSDRKETTDGSDPLCATGESCDKSIENTQLVSDDTLNLQIGIASSTTNVDEMLQSMMSGQASAAQLRFLLSEGGADETMLEQLSDEDLLAAYQDMLINQEPVE